jgi:hypothetical protein
MHPGPLLARALGALDEGPRERVSLYLPSRDAHGNPVDTALWVAEAEALLTRLAGGATVLPPSAGTWRPGPGEALVREQVVQAYAFATAQAIADGLPLLRAFLHRLGRETGQGEVACEIGGLLFRICDFDPA